jgi:hypothetical protein
MEVVAKPNICLLADVQAESKGDIATMISLQGAIKFNGGGKVCHLL